LARRLSVGAPSACLPRRHRCPRWTWVGHRHLPDHRRSQRAGARRPRFTAADQPVQQFDYNGGPNQLRQLFDANGQPCVPFADAGQGPGPFSIVSVTGGKALHLDAQGLLAQTFRPAAPTSSGWPPSASSPPALTPRVPGSSSTRPQNSRSLWPQPPPARTSALNSTTAASIAPRPGGAAWCGAPAASRRYARWTARVRGPW